MKKWLMTILLSFTVMLYGCKGLTNEVTPFRSAVNNFKIQETSGYYFKTTQSIDNTTYNEDSVDARIQWDELKMYIEFYEKRLNPFESDSLYSEKNYTTYFYNNQIGYQLDDETVTWKSGTQEEYLTFGLPIKANGLNIKQFETYEVTEVEGSKTLQARMKITKNILGYNQTVEYLDLTIVLDVNNKLVSMEIILQQELTQIHMQFEVYYEPQVVIIP